MTIIEKIVAKLQRHEGAKYRVTDHSITVAPRTDDGFTVDLVANAGHYTVGFEGWHEEFETEESALECFAFGMSDQCRLRVDLCGNSPYRWTLESKEGDDWVADSTTGLLLFPFWRRRRTIYRQNAWFTG